MIKYENDCVGCERCGHCGRDKTPYLYCDECHESYEELYNYDGEELCEHCLLEKFDKITLD